MTAQAKKYLHRKKLKLKCFHVFLLSQQYSNFSLVCTFRKTPRYWWDSNRRHAGELPAQVLEQNLIEPYNTRCFQRTSLQLRKLWGNLKFKGKRKDASQPPEPNANDIEDQSINGGLDTEEPIVEELASLKAEPTCEIMTEQDDVDEPFRMSELQDADEISMHENSTVLGLNDLGEDEMTSPELSLHSDEKQSRFTSSLSKLSKLSSFISRTLGK